MTAPFTILAIDSGSLTVGYALMLASQVIEHGVLRAKATLPPPSRMESLSDELEALLRDCRPGVTALEVMVERQHTRKGERTTSLAVCATAGGILWGVARVVCREWGGVVVPISNVAWTRGSSKDDRKSRAKVLCPAYDAKRDAKGDRADAICLAEHCRKAMVKAAMAERSGQKMRLSS